MALFRCARRWFLTDELEELWCVECELIKEDYIQFFDSGSIDPCQDLLQIVTFPLEMKFGETGEDRACQLRRRRTSAFRDRLYVSKIKAKVLEAGQRREAGDHCLGLNVARAQKGKIKRLKPDELSGGQE